MPSLPYLFRAPCFAAILISLLSCQDQKEETHEQVPPRPESPLSQAITALETEAFSDEKEARRIENKGIVPHWDRFLAAPVSERLQVFAEFPFQSLQLGIASPSQAYDLGIKETTLTKGGKTIDRKQWAIILSEYQTKGYTLNHSDWHHASFHRNKDGIAISEVTFTLQGRQEKSEKETGRIQVKGTLRILWDESGDIPSPKEVSVLRGSIIERQGPPAFEIKATIEGQTVAASGRDSIGAVNVYDLNGDGLPEIILGKENKILWNKGNFRFDSRPLIPEGGQVFRTTVGLVADLNGDSIPDWVCSVITGDLGVWFGKLGGGFALPPYRIDLGKYKLRSPSVITAGDIDGDGDLDLYVGQWRLIYGEVPPENLWDANDGHGNTLLLNNGIGKFTDATEAAGLHKKRFRRTFSSSFLDLDGDRDLDLLVVSDFHGVDIFINNGKGKFTEKTNETIDNPYSFGMSHTVADYNLDGQLDFMVMGMGSTTARRLEKMKANPKQFKKTNQMRSSMGFGNRMYLNQGAGKYQQPTFLAQIARTGWSWGSTSFDFDNDGDQDIYAANGNISGKTTRDYCTNFWCRDIYHLDKFKLKEVKSYFTALPQIETQSWDGYQVNPLLVNQAGTGFKDFSYVLDVGIDQDCRCVISADLDLDGRVDLLVGRVGGTSGVLHNEKVNHERPALYVMKNVIPEAAERNWIGVYLQGAARVAPDGATITIQTGTSTQQAVVLNGDSLSCQHPTQKHFGLGSETEVKKITVHWPGGKSTVLKNPKIKKYHQIYAPVN